MNRFAIRFAAAALLGLAATPAAFASDAGLGYAYVGGTGENESVAYVGATPQGLSLAPATIVGSGGTSPSRCRAPCCPAWCSTMR